MPNHSTKSLLAHLAASKLQSNNSTTARNQFTLPSSIVQSVCNYFESE